MARMSQQKFLAQLQSGKLIPAILLLGDEPYLRDACRAELIEKFVPEGSRMWGVSRLFGGSRRDRTGARGGANAADARAAASHFHRRPRAHRKTRREKSRSDCRCDQRVSRKSGAVHGAGAGGKISRSADEAGQVAPRYARSSWKSASATIPKHDSRLRRRWQKHLRARKASNWRAAPRKISRNTSAAT